MINSINDTKSLLWKYEYVGDNPLVATQSSRTIQPGSTVMISHWWLGNEWLICRHLDVQLSSPNSVFFFQATKDEVMTILSQGNFKKILDKN